MIITHDNRTTNVSDTGEHYIAANQLEVGEPPRIFLADEQQIAFNELPDAESADGNHWSAVLAPVFPLE